MQRAIVFTQNLHVFLIKISDRNPRIFVFFTKIRSILTLRK